MCGPNDNVMLFQCTLLLSGAENYTTTADDFVSLLLHVRTNSDEKHRTNSMNSN